MRFVYSNYSMKRDKFDFRKLLLPRQCDFLAQDKSSDWYEIIRLIASGATRTRRLGSVGTTELTTLIICAVVSSAWPARSMLSLRDAREIGIGRIADSSILTIFISEESRFDEKVHLPFLEPNQRAVNNEKKTGERTRVNEHELRTRRVENKESSLFSHEFFPEKKTRTKCNGRRPRSLYLTASSTIFVFKMCNSASTRISANSSFKSLLVQ